MLIHKWHDTEINQMPEDGQLGKYSIPKGYVNATQMCKANGKLLTYYTHQKSTKLYLQALAKDLCIDISDLVIKVTGYRDQQGTWVHPEVAIDLAHFLGRPFKKWFIGSFHNTNYEWVINKCVPELLSNALINVPIPVRMINDKKLVFEKEVRNRLAKEENGQIEIQTPIGFIDVLTDSEIIEVKDFKDWKSAIGQIMAYGIYFPKSKKRIHLFGNIGRTNLKEVIYVCKKLSVRLSYELEGF
jgi:hypothetical protein